MNPPPLRGRRKGNVEPQTPAVIHSPDTGRPTKTSEMGKIVEYANSMPYQEFFDRYMPKPSFLKEVTRHFPEAPPTLLLQGDANALKGNTLEQCLSLIEQTSAEDYRNSEIKWSKPKKRKEMMLPDMRYVVLTTADHAEHVNVVGFISFMITYEDGHEVIYCYEVHLNRAWQGKGVGKLLMHVIEGIGRNVGVEKAMLTVFKSNQNALKMYERLGYVEDKYSPKPRILRNGTVKELSYVILSKPLKIAE